MGFGSLFRSSSSQQKHIASRKLKHDVRNQKAHSVRGQRDAAAAYYRAKQMYEEAESRIMKEELRKRNQNDAECKRHMHQIEQRRIAERKRLEHNYVYDYKVAVASYRAEKIDHIQLAKLQRKQKEAVDRSWAKFMKWYTAEQAKAQRIFHARGEEIGASTGAALRRAKARMEHDQRIAV